MTTGPSIPPDNPEPREPLENPSPWIGDTFLGPDVLLVRHLRNGKTEREFLPALLATEDLASNPRNGSPSPTGILSAHIFFFDVSNLWGTSP